MFYFSTSLQLRMKIPTWMFRDVVLGCEAFWTLDHGIRSSVVFVSLGGMKCDQSADGHIFDNNIALSHIVSLKQNTMSIDCPPLLSAYWGGNIILSSHPLPTFWQKNPKKKLQVNSMVRLVALWSRKNSRTTNENQWTWVLHCWSFLQAICTCDSDDMEAVPRIQVLKP